MNKHSNTTEEDVFIDCLKYLEVLEQRLKEINTGQVQDKSKKRSNGFLANKRNLYQEIRERKKEIFSAYQKYQDLCQNFYDDYWFIYPKYN